MTWTPIHKPARTCPAPNLDDYGRVCSVFSWSQARQALDGLPGGRGLNIAHEAVDRYAAGACADKVALRQHSWPRDVGGHRGNAHCARPR